MSRRRGFDSGEPESNCLADGNWITTWSALRQHSGLTDAVVHLFVTRQAIHRGPPEADFEADRIEWIPLADAPTLIADGQVKDASTATALLWLPANLV